VPKLKPQELESRRQEIIDAARVCFLRHGFHQTTTDAICREANITPGGLYHYFGSKDELIAAVIDASAQAVVDQFRASLEESTDAQTAFQQMASFFMQTVQSPDFDKATRLEVEIWAEALKNPDLAERAGRAWIVRQEWLEALIQRAIDEGMYEADSVDPAGIASLFLAMFIGMRIGRILWPEKFDGGGALRALMMMHTGRLIARVPQVEVAI
jgi:AcrR family transcriptional regulator